MADESFHWKDTPAKILRESYWAEVRRRMDDLGAVIHRSEDPQTRLAFVNLVRAVQQYDDSTTK